MTIENPGYYRNTGRPVFGCIYNGLPVYVTGQQKPAALAQNLVFVFLPRGDLHDFPELTLHASEEWGINGDQTLNADGDSSNNGFLNAAELVRAHEVMMDLSAAGALDSHPLFRGEIDFAATPRRAP